MDIKKHFKLYKAGKLWLTAAVALMSFAVSAGLSQAYADDGGANATANNVQVATTTNTGDNSVALSGDTNTTTSIRTAATTNTQSTDQTSINGYTNNNNVWQNQSGQRANGWQASGSDWYYFNNGTQEKDWQSINNNWYYLNPDTAKMATGIQKINNNTYYLNDQQNGSVPYGAMMTGWQYTNNGWYHFKGNGAADTGWIKPDSNWYYLNPDTAKMETGVQKIDGQTYYLNPNTDGTAGAMKTGWQYTDNSWYHFQNNGAANIGWLKGNDGNWYYLNPDTAKLETGIQKIGSNTYYLNTNVDGSYGAMKTGWQYVDGHWYGFKNDGSAYLGWQNLGGNVYYFDTDNAQMATGDTLINGNHYYFDPQSGHQLKGTIVDANSHLLKYFDLNTGIRQTSLGNYKFDPQTGAIEVSSLNNGLNKIGNQTYYYDAANKTFKTNDWEKINGSWYLFGNNGAAYIGWYKSPAGFWYYFDNNNANALTGWQKINGAWYLFDNNNANADTGWYKYKGSWYYLDPVNAWAHAGWYKSPAGFWYYFDNNNGNALTGWQKINGAWYLFDNNNANAYTGWYKSAAGFWYYFDPTNAWADTGYHVINGVEYYFDPSSAYMYSNRWVNVNGWTYHADNSGHLWFPRWYSQFSPRFVAEGCSVFSLAILLSAKEYINIPYALSLLQYRQGGNIYSGAGFSLIIQPNSLVNLAHYFDSSVRNISGTSVQGIINEVNSGHPVQYYGYSSYERSYWARNHNKVIVGYRNGYFRIYDPCYSYAGQGSTGQNAYDYGSMAWVSVGQFSREYAGQAITVD